MSDIDTEIEELLRRQRDLIEQKALLRKQAREITDTLKSLTPRIRQLKKAQGQPGSAEKMKRDIEIVVMRYGEGLSARTIAAKFDRSPTWADWRCRIALRHLRHPSNAQQKMEVEARIEKLREGAGRDPVRLW